MSSAHKEHLKSLKSPDQFQAKAMTLIEWMVGHTKLLVLVAAPVALGVAGVYAFQSFQDSKRSSRSEELGKIQVVYDAEERKVADERDIIAKKVADPKFAAEKDALTKQADALKADHLPSAVKYTEFFNKYKDKPEGWAAGLMAADAYLNADKVDDAIPLLEGVLANSKTVAFYQTTAGLLLANLYIQKGELDKALAQVDGLSKNATDDLQAKAKFVKAKILNLKNQKDEAKALFTEIVEKHPQSPEANKAQAMLLVIR